jgi:hypothetical protein
LAAIQEAYVQGISTRSVDDLVTPGALFILLITFSALPGWTCRSGMRI